MYSDSASVISPLNERGSNRGPANRCEMSPRISSQPSGKFNCPWGRLHAVAAAGEQCVVKQGAQPRQGFAHSRLSDEQTLSGA